MGITFCGSKVPESRGTLVSIPVPREFNLFSVTLAVLKIREAVFS
jgi:hypothetical protein